MDTKFRQIVDPKILADLESFLESCLALLEDRGCVICGKTDLASSLETYSRGPKITNKGPDTSTVNMALLGKVKCENCGYWHIFTPPSDMPLGN